MKYSCLCFDLMFLSNTKKAILVYFSSDFTFSGFKVNVTNDLLCDILLSLSLIPF